MTFACVFVSGDYPSMANPSWPLSLKGPKARKPLCDSEKRETNRYLLFLQGDDHAFQSTSHSPPVSYFGWHGLPRSEPECGPRAGISIQADQNDRAFSCWRNDRHRGPYRGPAHERVDGPARAGRQPWWCRWSDWCGLGRESCA